MNWCIKNKNTNKTWALSTKITHRCCLSHMGFDTWLASYSWHAHLKKHQAQGEYLKALYLSSRFIMTVALSPNGSVASKLWVVVVAGQVLYLHFLAWLVKSTSTPKLEQYFLQNSPSRVCPCEPEALLVDPENCASSHQSPSGLEQSTDSKVIFILQKVLNIISSTKNYSSFLPDI